MQVKLERVKEKQNETQKTPKQTKKCQKHNKTKTNKPSKSLVIINSGSKSKTENEIHMNFSSFQPKLQGTVYQKFKVW